MKKWWQRVRVNVMGGATALTVVKDLTIAVAIGVILAGIIVLVEFDFSPNEKVVREQSAAISVFSVHPDIKLINFHGPLFFVGVENAGCKIREIPGKSTPVLDFSNISVINTTEAQSLRDFVWRLQNNSTYGVSTFDAPCAAAAILGKGGSSCVSVR